MKRIVIAMFVLVLASVSVTLAAKPANYTKPVPGTPEGVSSPKQIDVSDFETLERLGLRPGRLEKEWCGLNYHAGSNSFVYDCVPAGTAIYTNGDDGVVYKADCGNLLVAVEFDCPEVCPGGVHISQDELDRLREEAATDNANAGDWFWTLLKWLMILAGIALLVWLLLWLLKEILDFLESRNKNATPTRMRQYRRACPNTKCQNHFGTFDDQKYCEYCDSPLMVLDPDGSPVIQHPPAQPTEPVVTPATETTLAEPATDSVEETQANAPTPPIVPVPTDIPPSGQDPEDAEQTFNGTRVTFPGNTLRLMREQADMAYSVVMKHGALYIYDSDALDVRATFNDGKITLDLVSSNDARITDR